MKTDHINPLDVQVDGSHYKDYPIQPLEYNMANKLDACQANVVKYVTRFREKNGKRDLVKAQHYLELLIFFEYGAEDNEPKQRDYHPPEPPLPSDVCATSEHEVCERIRSEVYQVRGS